MRTLGPPFLLMWCASIASACAGRTSAPARSGSSSQPGEPGVAPSTVETGASPSAAEGSPGESSAPAPRLVPIVESGPPLPELKVKTFGLHVGGGRNDDAERQPLLRALERQFPRLLECYALLEEPGKSGTFGVDLHIAAAGGAPRAGQPRTALKGEDFKRCMLRAFESVRFERLERPTVVSYSVKFSLGAD